MGREVRRVPIDWVHPRDEFGDFMPLFDGAKFLAQAREWDEHARRWEEGLCCDSGGNWHPIKPGRDGSFESYAGGRPDAKRYMPVWDDSVATFLMMYETTSEGTPLSPSFEKQDDLARWMTERYPRALGGIPLDFEYWQRIAAGDWAPDLVIQRGRTFQGITAI